MPGRLCWAGFRVPNSGQKHDSVLDALMRLLRLVFVVTILLSTLMLAQSTSLTNSPLVSKGELS